MKSMPIRGNLETIGKRKEGKMPPISLASVPVVLHQMILPRRGHLAMSGDAFGCYSWGRGAPSI